MKLPVFVTGSLNRSSWCYALRTLPEAALPHCGIPATYIDFGFIYIRCPFCNRNFWQKFLNGGCLNPNCESEIFEIFHEILTFLDVTVQHTMTFLLFILALGIHFLDLLPNRINLLCRWIWVNLVGFRF